MNEGSPTLRERLVRNGYGIIFNLNPGLIRTRYWLNAKDRMTSNTFQLMFTFRLNISRFLERKKKLWWAGFFN